MEEDHSSRKATPGQNKALGGEEAQLPYQHCSPSEQDGPWEGD